MQQLTLAGQAEFQRFAKTGREQFLEEMDAVMPWVELLGLVEPYYLKGETGRKPVGFGITRRVYFLRQWFALSDPGVEDALYGSPVLRRFVGAIWAVLQGRTRRPSRTSATCSKRRIYAGKCWMRSTTISRAAASASPRARSSTQRSSMRPVRPRTSARSATSDASDEEGQIVILRDEGAHRRR